MLDHRVRENTGGEAEVSAEAHCKAQVQLKQFPVHEHLASQRRLPLLCCFLPATFQTVHAGSPLCGSYLKALQGPPS